MQSAVDIFNTLRKLAHKPIRGQRHLVGVYENTTEDVGASCEGAQLVNLKFIFPFVAVI